VLTLDRAAFELAVDDFDLAVSLAPDVDAFCSSSAWTLSAHDAFKPPRELWCRKGEHGWALFARRRFEHGGASLEPLELAWCLASPLVCTGDATGFARELRLELAASAPFDVVVLAGLVPGSAFFAAIVSALEDRYRFRTDLVPPTRRFRASLDGGVPGFLSRRSKTFRTRLAQAERKALRAGVTFEPVVVTTEAEASALHARLVAMEQRSWKWNEGGGLAVPEMAEFYRSMLPRLARKGAVRAAVGTRAGEDVAIIVGGVSDTADGVVYRGLSFSFDDAHRPLSLGNLAQLAQIRALVERESVPVALYDLGSEVEYKARWGEVSMETVTLVAVPMTPPRLDRNEVLDSPVRQ
jgi:hypothetical protein